MDHKNKSLTIIRPTVVYGEHNRGNVYNLLHQIASGKFLMVGNGKNKKSMAYVGNLVAFIENRLRAVTPGYSVFNYVDKPDFDMNQLIEQIEISLKKKLPSLRIPYFLGMTVGLVFDFLSLISGKKLPVSSMRIRKFCATTQFTSKYIEGTGYRASFSHNEGLDRTIKNEFKQA